ncbi:uncharacterized protein L199_004787 [Kwoniella botswanensis]|uniref:uncharacterized protein n=1 Tax=Kwoniella botswanensis TaxID=1268659 RepID=UPI00315CBE55
MSCQTCSSELPPNIFKQSFITPCCSTPICPSCINRNPRLKEYIPCLRCGDPRTSELKGGASISRLGESNGSRNDIGLARDVVRSNGDEVVFEIGDSDDDDDEDDADAPPGYEDISSQQNNDTNRNEQIIRDGTINEDLSESELDTSKEPTDTSTPDNTISTPAVIPTAGEGKCETVEVTHQIQKSDTLLSISRRYATDPHELLSLNNLPYTALSTHPRILHTRKTLIILRRQIPLSKIPSHPYTSPPQPDGNVNNEEREKSKQLKRFQLLTKNTDLGIANTYLNLSELEESLGDDPLESGSGETIDGHKKKQFANKENREQRALESFFEDDEWEKEHGGSLSKLRVNVKQSTGQGKGKGGGSSWNILSAGGMKVQ